MNDFLIMKTQLFSTVTTFMWDCEKENCFEKIMDIGLCNIHKHDSLQNYAGILTKLSAAVTVLLILLTSSAHYIL